MSGTEWCLEPDDTGDRIHSKEEDVAATAVGSYSDVDRLAAAVERLAHETPSFVLTPTFRRDLAYLLLRVSREDDSFDGWSEKKAARKIANHIIAVTSEGGG